MNTEEFVQFVTEKVESVGAKVSFPMEKSVVLPGEITQCNGYWDKGTMTLAAARDQDPDSFLRLLVHEYCHFRQWAEKREPYWNLYDPELKADLESVFFGWIEGQDTDLELVKYAGTACRDMELDCERLTVKTIKELELPIDLVDYTKRAAAYVLFYNVIIETRKWYAIGEEPYNNPEIIKLMPDNLDGDFKTTPPEVAALMK